MVIWTIVLLTNIIDSGTVWVKIAYRKEAWPTWNFDKHLCLAGTRSVGLWVATQDYAVKTKKNLDPWMQVDSFRYLSLANWFWVILKYIKALCYTQAVAFYCNDLLLVHIRNNTWLIIALSLYFLVGDICCSVQEALRKGGYIWISWVHALSYGNKILKNPTAIVFVRSLVNRNGWTIRVYE